MQQQRLTEQDHGRRGSRDRAASAFTLAEMMVAIFVSTLALAALMTLFAMSLHAWNDGSVDLSLQSSGRLIMEKIVRGPSGLFGLREAGEEDVTVDANGKGITFLVDKNTEPTFTREDDTQLRIFYLDGRVMYDPSSEFVGDEVPLASFGRVEDICFEVNGNEVKIELWMGETASQGPAARVKLQTKVYLRKARDPDHLT
jgi:type II secretory pathway pseudopilin PulG